ncbi:oligoendopeptidase F [Paenibacillus bovis]|uniref:Oligopeptidase F n=1 Tax=Paenibacillus bovis TaxID=1616788 RepID=A0A172ZCW0_9BACL|nr:oligoendopeptidase F [Paenibacillus bovis]ANF95486.1 oligoendopeptidase F [Paenibacillus bovis]
MSKILTRSEVPVSSTWNISDLYATEADWEKDLRALQQLTDNIQSYQGRLGESAQTLYECLNQQESLIQKAMKIGSYASLQQSEDGTNPANMSRAARSGDVLSAVYARLTWIDSEILDLPEGTITQYVAGYPALAVYERSLNLLLDTRPHRLSPDVEATLAAMGEVTGAPYRIYLRSKLADMTFDDAVDQQGQVQPVSFRLYENAYEVSPDTELRRSSFASFTRTLSQYRNTIAETYATEVKKQIVLARLRGYESVTDMLLQPQQVTRDMYDNIHNVLLRELAPHMQRLARLKQRVLGLDRMTFCDLKAPLDPDYNPSVSFAEAENTVKEALQIMGTEYMAIMEEAFSSRWIDYADNVGKSTGAFCSSIYGEHAYILMAWADNMRNAFTLAHELGHAGHLTLAARNQRLSNYRPSLYYIEAPSTMNELLLADHLMKSSQDKQLRRWVILQLLSTYYHNFVTHLLEAELQRRVYDAAMHGQAITADWLSATKGEVLAGFWGDTVEIDEGARLTWMRQPHYYMGLYPYTYAAGLTASTAAMQQIRDEGQPAVDRWLTALKAGGSLPPLELMQLAGVDMSGPQPISTAADYVGSLISELESLYE